MSLRNLTTILSFTTKSIFHKNATFFLKPHTFPLNHSIPHHIFSTTTSPPLLRHHSTTTTTTIMEVEVKLRLPDSKTHQNLSNILSPHHQKTHFQENIFFDTLNSDLSSNLAALRLRFYDLDTLCVISIKAKTAISMGISTTEEDEEAIDPSIGRACVAEPWRLLLLDSSRIMKRVKEEFNIGSELVCLGGFRNVRGVYQWNGLKLELDETHFDFGTCYEIECESSEPEKAKKMIEELLSSNGIQFSYSSLSKFAVFRSGKMPQ